VGLQKMFRLSHSYAWYFPAAKLLSLSAKQKMAAEDNAIIPILFMLNGGLCGCPSSKSARTNNNFNPLQS